MYPLACQRFKQTLSRNEAPGLGVSVNPYDKIFVGNIRKKMQPRYASVSHRQRPASAKTVGGEICGRATSSRRARSATRREELESIITAVRGLEDGKLFLASHEASFDLHNIRGLVLL